MNFQIAALLNKKCIIVKLKSYKPLYESISATNQNNQ